MTSWILFSFYIVLCGYLKRDKNYWGIVLVTVVWLIGTATIPLEQPTPTQIQVPTTKGR